MRSFLGQLDQWKDDWATEMIGDPTDPGNIMRGRMRGTLDFVFLPVWLGSRIRMRANLISFCDCLRFLPLIVRRRFLLFFG